MQALLITDRPQLRKLFSAILNDEDSELTTEARIEEAPDLGHERKWSIVFCDVILSGADGSNGLQRPKQIWLTPAPGASVPEIERASVQEEWSSLSAVEGRYIQEVLTHTHGNKQAAARILKIDRKTLDRMIKRHQIAVASHARFASGQRVVG